MALRVATQYMARVNPQVADRAVDIAHGLSPEDGNSKGLKTVKHIFSTGAKFLKKLVVMASGYVAGLECFPVFLCLADLTFQEQLQLPSVSNCCPRAYPGNQPLPTQLTKHWRHGWKIWI